MNLSKMWNIQTWDNLKVTELQLITFDNTLALYSHLVLSVSSTSTIYNENEIIIIIIIIIHINY